MTNLDWPPELGRTPENERERNQSFQATLGATTGDLETELERMDVDNWRVSIGNQHTKSNGMPLHNANPDDPGFVLQWSDGNEQFAVACDASPRLRDNARYVYKWVHETRMRSQRPVATGDSEFATARLPPGNEESEAVVAREPPHVILGIAPNAPESVVRGAARALKAETHPDGGGTQKEFQRAVDAEERMLNEIDV